MQGCAWFCEWLGSGYRIRLEVPGAFHCLIVICPLTAAKLGWRKRSLLHINGCRSLRDPAFFHVAERVASTMNRPLTIYL